MNADSPPTNEGSLPAILANFVTWYASEGCGCSEGEIRLMRRAFVAGARTAPEPDYDPLASKDHGIARQAADEPDYDPLASKDHGIARQAADEPDYDPLASKDHGIARQAADEPGGNGWTCVTERLPTEGELKAGVLFGIHWPEGRVEMVSWDMEYQHDYELMCRHFEVFQPDRSSGTGYWRTSASIAPPRSGLTKIPKPTREQYEPGEYGTRCYNDAAAEWRSLNGGGK
jgi:hypothetical protein